MNSTQNETIRVTCAIIFEDGKVLAALRSRQMTRSWNWEFPGGKIDNGELPEQCIIREIKEELDVDINIDSALTPIVHAYPEKTIELIPFLCHIHSGHLKAVEHEKVSWFKPDQLESLNWAPADTPVLKEFLSMQLSSIYR